MSDTVKAQSKPKGCTSTNMDGSPCSARPWKDGVCRWHHPSLGEERRKNAVKGGKARSTAARARKALSGDLRDMATVKAALLTGLNEVRSGAIEPAVYNAMANGARALVMVAGVADFESQLNDMRQEITEIKDERSAS